MKVSIDSWGPSAWNFLHAVSFTLPYPMTQIDIEHYKQFFNSLQWILPCKVCQNHLKEKLAMLPLDVSSTRACSEWVFKLHNLVNESINKPVIKDYLAIVAEYLPQSMYHKINPTKQELERLKSISASKTQNQTQTQTQNQNQTPRSNTTSGFSIITITILSIIVVFLIIMFMCVCYKKH